MEKDMLLCELQTKDVINVKTAKCLGRVMERFVASFFMNVNTGFHGTRYAVSERI